MKFKALMQFGLVVVAVLFLPAGAAAQLKVVTSTPDLGSIARAVGGDRVEVVSLARGSEDPHFVSPRPSFIPILNRADVLIEGGAELESSWLPPLVRTARNAAIFPGRAGHIAVARHISVMGAPTGPIDRSMGDVHASGNPHFMLDPKNGQEAARVIAGRFSDLDPDGAKEYGQNLQLFLDQIEEGLARWEKALEPFKGTRVVTYHKNFDYLARRFGFIIAGEIEPLAGIEPSPRHIAALIDSMREESVPMIWMEPFRPRRTPARVAEQTGAQLVFLPEQVGAVEGTENYIVLFDYHVRQIVEAMTQ